MDGAVAGLRRGWPGIDFGCDIGGNGSVARAGSGCSRHYLLCAVYLDATDRQYCCLRCLTAMVALWRLRCLKADFGEYIAAVVGYNPDDAVAFRVES